MQPGRRRISAAMSTRGAGVHRRPRLSNRNWAPTNIEFNVPPRPLAGRTALDLESEVRKSLNAAETKANTDGAHIVMVGILPTLMPEHLSGSWMSPSMRYQALNDSIFTARGEDILIDITGAERLSMYSESIAPESRLHQYAIASAGCARRFARTGTPPRCCRSAAGAGRELAVLLRPPAVGRDPHRIVHAGHRYSPLKSSSLRLFWPRVWFEGTVDHVDLRSVRGERPLLPVAAARCPTKTWLPNWQRAAHHGYPNCACTTAPSTGGTGPSDDVVGEGAEARPHLRVENRVLPAAPPSWT